MPDAPPIPPRCAHCGLRASGAFHQLAPGELGFVEDLRSATERVPAGHALIREQADGGRLFTLYAGWAFRYKTLSDGRRQILNFLLPGDLFGLQQRFSEGATYGVEALTDVSVCVFQGTRLWELYRAHPRLGYDLTWLCAREEQMLDENLLTTGRRSAVERVAVLLIHLFKRMQRLGLVDGDNGCPFPLTQQHMADALGLSLVHTHRTLRRLQALGLHTLDEGRLVLRNPGALTQLADYATQPLEPLPLL
ncbi:Crp/Fnr family transcriptional regulator [Pseudorhodoferax sp. Leaf274]|uniref:Crp/Fnr family transcriptional regulator n=1 Tax=Pseudorhodoferax sp. Leaf274 TaxID=1736318 RepID=UPI001F379EEB|nr:Crp/Fnr family transcriptional regulator [Pseudorhodoferax sp. Leaf274]